VYQIAEWILISSYMYSGFNVKHKNSVAQPLVVMGSHRVADELRRKYSVVAVQGPHEDGYLQSIRALFNVELVRGHVSCAPAHNSSICTKSRPLLTVIRIHLRRQICLFRLHAPIHLSSMHMRSITFLEIRTPTSSAHAKTYTIKDVPASCLVNEYIKFYW